MKKLAVLILTTLCTLCAVGLFACGGPKASNTFKIEASSQTYFIDKATPITFSTIERDLEEVYSGWETEYFVVGENAVDAVITDNKFTATKKVPWKLAQRFLVLKARIK